MSVGDAALPITVGTMYDREGRTRLSFSHSPVYGMQDSDVHYDDLRE